MSLLRVVLLILTSALDVYAGQSGVSGPMPRWPMILAGVVFGVGGLVVARVWRGWSSRWSERAVFVAGALVASLGAFFAVSGTTITPPLYSSGDRLDWVENLDEAFERARVLERPVMIDFTAEWCNACHELEAEVFYQPEVASRLRGRGRPRQGRLRHVRTRAEPASG